MPHICSWGKVSINFDIWDEPRKYYQHQGRKAGYMSNINADFAHLSYQVSQKCWTTQNWDLRMTDHKDLKIAEQHTEFAASHIYPCSLPFPERKKVVYSILLRNLWRKENHVPPLPCFPMGILSLHSHYLPKSAERPETACPLPLGQQLKGARQKLRTIPGRWWGISMEIHHLPRFI